MVRNIRKFFCLLLPICIILSSVTMVACSNLFGIDDNAGDLNDTTINTSPSDEEIKDDPTTKDYENGISFAEENEGYQPKIIKKEIDDYIGKWEATSGNAHYLFGNLELDIKEGGIWTGNVTDEKVGGTWTEINNGISLKGDLFSCQLGFSSDNNLLLKYVPFEDSTDSIIIVLTRK